MRLLPASHSRAQRHALRFGRHRGTRVRRPGCLSNAWLAGRKCERTHHSAHGADQRRRLVIEHEEHAGGATGTTYCVPFYDKTAPAGEQLTLLQALAPESSAEAVLAGGVPGNGGGDDGVLRCSLLRRLRVHRQASGPSACLESAVVTGGARTHDPRARPMARPTCHRRHARLSDTSSL